MNLNNGDIVLFMVAALVGDCGNCLDNFLFIFLLRFLHLFICFVILFGLFFCQVSSFHFVLVWFCACLVSPCLIAHLHIVTTILG
jgi:hypothetical protein